MKTKINYKPFLAALSIGAFLLLTPKSALANEVTSSTNQLPSQTVQMEDVPLETPGQEEAREETLKRRSSGSSAGIVAAMTVLMLSRRRRRR